MTLCKENVKSQIISFEYNRLLSDKTGVDSELIKQLSLLYDFKQLEVPFVYKQNNIIKLYVPKNTYCKFVFSRSIAITHDAQEDGSILTLHHDESYLECAITDPIFSINLHINDNTTERIELWYTKHADGQYQMPNIIYTSIDQSNVHNFKISITDVSEKELDTVGDCFLHFKMN